MKIGEGKWRKFILNDKVQKYFMNRILKIIFLDLESMCMSVLPACTYVHHIHTWCPWRPEEVVWVPGTGVTMWVLGIKPGSSERTIGVLNHWAILTAPNLLTFCVCEELVGGDKVALCIPSWYGAHYVAKQASNLQRSVCLYLQSATIKGMCHHKH